MSCGSYNFNIKRGSTKVFSVVYTDVSGSAKDLTGYNARMYFRDDPESSTAALQLHSTSSTANHSKLILSGSAGTIQVYISAADSALLARDSYFYDLEVYTNIDPYATSDPEFVTRILEGVATTSYNITR